MKRAQAQSFRASMKSYFDGTHIQFECFDKKDLSAAEIEEKLTANCGAFRPDAHVWGSGTEVHHFTVDKQPSSVASAADCSANPASSAASATNTAANVPPPRASPAENNVAADNVDTANISNVANNNVNKIAEKNSAENSNVNDIRNNASSDIEHNTNINSNTNNAAINNVTNANTTAKESVDNERGDVNNVRNVNITNDEVCKDENNDDNNNVANGHNNDRINDESAANNVISGNHANDNNDVENASNNANVVKSMNNVDDEGQSVDNNVVNNENKGGNVEAKQSHSGKESKNSKKKAASPVLPSWFATHKPETPTPVPIMAAPPFVEGNENKTNMKSSNEVSAENNAPSVANNAEECEKHNHITEEESQIRATIASNTRAVEIQRKGQDALGSNVDNAQVSPVSTATSNPAESPGITSPEVDAVDAPVSNSVSNINASNNNDDVNSSSNAAVNQSNTDNNKVNDNDNEVAKNVEENNSNNSSTAAVTDVISSASTSTNIPVNKRDPSLGSSAHIASTIDKAVAFAKEDNIIPDKTNVDFPDVPVEEDVTNVYEANANESAAGDKPETHNRFPTPYPGTNLGIKAEEIVDNNDSTANNSNTE